MKQKPWLILFVLSLLVGAAGIYFSIADKKEGRSQHLQRRAAQLERQISKAIELIDKTKLLKKVPDATTRKNLENQHIQYYVFRGNNPIDWSSNEWFLENHQIPPGYFIRKTKLGYYLIGNFKNDSVTWVLGLNLITEKNKYDIFNDEEINNQNNNQYTLVRDSQSFTRKINVAGISQIYLKSERYLPSVLPDYLLLFGIFLFLLSTYFLFKNNLILNRWRTVFLWFSILTLLVLFYKDYVLFGFKKYALFSPELYASSWYFPNLGTMLIDLILVVFATFYIKSFVHFFGNISTKWVRIVWTIITGTVLFFSIYFVLSESEKMVLDSSIHFDLHKIHLVNIYTFIGVIAIASGYLAVYNLWQITEIMAASVMPKKIKKWAGSILTIVVLSLSIYNYHALTLGYGIVLLGIFGIYWVHHRYRDIYKVVSRLVIPALSTSVIFNHAVDQKEKDTRQIIATKILLKNEKEPEALLSKTENLLKKDNAIIDYYTCMDETKSQFENRLNNLYLGEYAEDYEIQILDFDSVGRFYREPNAFDFNSINYLYSSNICKPVSANFSYVNEMKLRGSYLGKFNIIYNSRYKGSYFILLKPQTGEFKGRFSDLIQTGPFEQLFAENQYSYAIFAGNKLNRRFGNYNYPNNLDTTIKEGNYDLNDYNHSVYSDDLNNVIVFSKPNKSLIDSLTGFTFLLLIALFLSLLALLFLWLRRRFLWLGPLDFKKIRYMLKNKQRWAEFNGKGLFLSNRIQLYVILVVFSTFVVILIMTMNYFNNNYYKSQQQKLWERTTDIANVIGTQTNLNDIFDQFRTGLVYDLSNYYKTDINIYRADGRLLVSSNDKLYAQEFMGNIMNPDAYKKLHLQGSSGYIEEERLGKLNYISAYYALVDNNLQIRGYLNLPYFSNRKDLYREISGYAVSLINLFALVFALAALVAYILARRITEPLNLVRKQMGVVKFGSSNTPLTWNRKDEIGLLIEEYNSMLLKLEESTNRLAESERQGAWREMAKQVAHEIKNPLTPMKLSLQHLQFAIDRKDDHLEEKIKKTSTLLIDQIDSLSKMAEEFSSFAKMPEAKMEKFQLKNILESCIQLMEKDYTHCKVSYDLPADNIQVQADGHQLGRVFTNIIKNAQQAMEQQNNGSLHIHSTQEENKIKICFEDTGKGIPDDLKDKIFSPNFSTKNSGMGLGLAISKKIIEGFGGKIWFESISGTGTKFFVELPILIE